MFVQTNGFVFDGRSSDDFGLLICNFDGSEPSESSGGEIEITKTESPIQNRWYKSGNSNYTSALQFSFSVAKHTFEPCDAYDYSAINRWLCRKDGYKDFMITRRDYDNVHYYAQFNITPIEVAGNIVGITVNGVTDSPFGYSQLITNTFEVNGFGAFTLFDLSDEIGYIYPDIEIEVNDNCDIKIINQFDGSVFKLNNCVANEIIKIDGKYLQMNTTALLHNLYNDTNYMFPKIMNDYSNRKNVFEMYGNFVITMKYRQIRKVGI